MKSVKEQICIIAFAQGLFGIFEQITVLFELLNSETKLLSLLFFKLSSSSSSLANFP
jgi:hypothetical protein